VAEMDMKGMRAGDGIILRGIYRQVVEQGIWRVRTDQELRESHKDLEKLADFNPLLPNDIYIYIYIYVVLHR
jgi:hypothetical protein